MTPNDLQSPPSVEAPPPSAGPDPSKGPQQDPHYRDSETECFQCAHFQDPDVCALGVNGGQTTAGAGCDLFELKSDGSNDQDDQGGPPMPGGQGAPPQSMPQGSPQQ